MKLLSIACLVLCVGFTMNANAQSPTGVTFTPVVFNGHTYQLTPSPDTWTASEAYALTLGGHLVSITSQAEQNFIVSTFLGANSPLANSPLWIGLTDQPNHDSRAYTNWTTGEAVTYTNFFQGEPNNLQTNEDYVALNWHYSFGSSSTQGQWNDLPNGGSTENYGGNNARALGPYYGIVEISPTTPVVPEPGTVWMLVAAAFGWVCIFRHKQSRRAL